jgi:hypothetical protein
MRTWAHHGAGYELSTRMLEAFRGLLRAQQAVGVAVGLCEENALWLRLGSRHRRNLTRKPNENGVTDIVFLALRSIIQGRGSTTDYQMHTTVLPGQSGGGFRMI